MPQATLRLNLHSASFPLLSYNQGRTVIYRDAGDQSPSGVSQENRWVSVPEAIYMHNILPTAQGLQSIGFRKAIPAASPPITAFKQIFTLRDEHENKVLFVPGDSVVYVCDGNTL